LAGNELRLTDISLRQLRVTGEEIIVSTLSPICVYSTFYRRDGSPYTCYFQPGQGEFDDLLSQNLVRKAKALRLDVNEIEKVLVKPLREPRMALVRYKKGVIKGYTGRYRLRANPNLLQVGLSAGFGARNAQGFGLCELEKEVNTS